MDKASSEQMTRIVGSVTILERIALPDNAYVVLKVRNSAGPDAMPVVADQRIDLKGAQPPVPFSMSIDRARLPMDIGFAFRAAIYFEGRSRYVSEQVPVNLSTNSVDLGVVVLKAFEAEPLPSN